MNKNLILTIALTISCVLLMSLSAHAVPETINFQGKLTYTNGAGLNGSYEMTFYLYDQETDGNLLWQEQQSAEIKEGIYSLQLGAVEPLSENLFIENQALFLEIEILNPNNGEWEKFDARERFTSTAYAMKAADADTAKTASSADTLDGHESAEFGDTHSLDAADGDPVDAVYVNNEGNVGIWTKTPGSRLAISGGATVGSTYAGTSLGDGIMAIAGNLGIGTTTPGSRIAISGGATVGSTYASAVLGDGSMAISGNLGIGTTNPTEHLVVDGATGDGRIATFKDSEYDNNYITIGEIASNAGGYLRYTKTGNYFCLGIHGGDSALNIHNANGNVGIWTKTPGSRLAISGGATVGSAYAETALGDGSLAISGNVGIGTTSPGSKLAITGGVTVGSSYAATSLGDGSMAISGNLGIGTTNPTEHLVV
ncbi:MAG: hypothetical protein ACMUIP_15230, partial [bacterium]